jgi:hypothetical protein
MHCENCAALLEFAVCAEPVLPPAPGDELPVGLLAELPPQPASATAELASTTATPAWILLTFIIVLPP